MFHFTNTRPPPKLLLMLFIHVIDDKLCKLGHPHHQEAWGHHRRHLMPTVMGMVTDAPRDCKTTLNIDIYPSALVFVENIGHNYEFDGDGVVSGRVWGWGWVVQIQREQYIFTYSQCLDYLFNQIIFLVQYF